MLTCSLRNIARRKIRLCLGYSWFELSFAFALTVHLSFKRVFGLLLAYILTVLFDLGSEPNLSQYIMSEGVPLPPAQEIKPGDTYQIDSEEYDSDQERDNLSDGEYDKLIEEGGFACSCV